jgi:DNA-binding NarL/FixJ family response regulator
MKGGTLVVSRAEPMYPYYKRRFSELGFGEVTITGAEKDALNILIRDMKPSLVILSSGFYEAGTPCMVGDLLELFPKLNIAVVSLHDFPLSVAPWFIWHGAKSYINMRAEGYDEFHRGVQAVRRGEAYIAPKVVRLMDYCGEWPDTKNKATKRQMECLIFLCCGFTPESMGEKMFITRATVFRTLANLYGTFHVKSREEMVALAWQLGLVTVNDIKFHDDRAANVLLAPQSRIIKSNRQLPEWAEIKLKCDRFQKTMRNEK